MSRNSKIVIALLLVGALAVGVIGYLASGRRAAQTASAIATVIGTEEERTRRSKYTIVTLSYSVQGTPAQGRARIRNEKPADYPNGRQVRVCYDPADTSSVRIDDGTCG